MADPRGVVQRHWDAVQSGDFDAIAADYAPDARFVRPGLTTAGRQGCREFFARLFDELDGFQARQDSVTVDGDVVLLEWSAAHADGRAARGVDTFVVRKGLIQTQTLAFHITPAADG